MSKGELILYTTEDGHATMQLHVAEGTVWLTQAEMAELFQSTKQNVSLHIRNILDDGELPEDSVVKDYLTVQKKVQVPMSHLDSTNRRYLAQLKEYLRCAGEVLP